MKKKRFIYLFLLLVSMIVVIAPAIPHHHHGDGIICMKDDIKQDNCCPVHHNHHHQGDDPCCNDGCVAQFNTVLPNIDMDEIQSPQFQYSVILFTQPLLSLLNIFEKKIPDKNYFYIESLHGTYITRAAGLRAPPYLIFA